MGTPASFKPGQSGNPNGRPKTSWKEVFEKEVERLVPTKDGKQKIKHLLAKAMIGEALKGDVPAFNALTNRMEGMPQQDMNLKGQIDHIVISREPVKELDAGKS